MGTISLITNTIKKKKFRAWVIRSGVFLAIIELISGLMTYFSVPSDSASTTYIVSPGQSITSVLNGMSAGDMCLIHAGTYSAFTVPKSGLTIKNYGDGIVTIDAQGRNYAISGSVSNITIQSLVLKNWGSSQSAGIKVSGNNWTIDHCYFDRGSAALGLANDPGVNDICFANNNGGHKVTNNTFQGIARTKSSRYSDGFPLYYFNVWDAVSFPNGGLTDADNSIISNNYFNGAADDELEFDVNATNAIVENNYFNGNGSSTCISLVPIITGPIYVRNNTMVNFGRTAIKLGAFSSYTSLGKKYIENNVMYSHLKRDSQLTYPDSSDQGNISLCTTNSTGALDNITINNNQSESVRYFAYLVGFGSHVSINNNKVYSTVNGQSSIVKNQSGKAISLSTLNGTLGIGNTYGQITYTSKPLPTIEQTINMPPISPTPTPTPTPTPSTYTLTINISGSGSVTENPDQSSYNPGSVVTLTANPANGYSLSGWSGDLSGNANPTTITMNNNETVTATFTSSSTSILDKQVVTGVDDAANRASSASTSWPTHSLGYRTESLYQAFRFTDITIPKGATITNAYLSFNCYTSTSSNIYLKIAAEASDNPTSPNTSTRLPSTLWSNKTAAAIDWDVTSATSWTSNSWYNSSDIKAVVQEIVNRSGWNSGNSLMLLISNDGGTYYREVAAYEVGATRAPKLHIEYSPYPG